MSEPTVHQSSSKRWVLVLLCVVQFMLVLDVAIVAVALPWIQDDLVFDVADLQWVVSAYALTFAGFLILGGRAGDLFGRRRFLVAGITVFTLASLACGLAQSSIWLVIARGVQGFGGAPRFSRSAEPVDHHLRRGCGSWSRMGTANRRNRRCAHHRSSPRTAPGVSMP